MKKILFISHEATKTGAPLVLLYFIQWLKNEHPDWTIHVAILKGGSMLHEFESCSDKVYFIPEIKTSPGNQIKYLARRIMGTYQQNSDSEANYLASMLAKVLSVKYDLIYANTIVAVPVAAKLKARLGYSPKLIAHLHEMNTIIKTTLPDFDSYTATIDHFISVSTPVSDNLTKNWNLSSDKISQVYEFTRINDQNKSITEDNDSFICGSSGVAHWRKGDDIFLLIAAYIKKEYPEFPIKFQWIGSIPDHHRPVLEEDLKKLELEKVVEFTGEIEDPLPYYKNFNVFLMVSREDPFPLVCIEAAMLEIPLICFDKATGTADILKNGGGHIVPYLDIKAMAERIIEYYKTPSLKLQDGKKAKELFNEFTPDIKCPEIMSVIKKLSI